MFKSNVIITLALRQASSGSRLWHAASQAVQRTPRPARPHAFSILFLAATACSSHSVSPDAGSGPLRWCGFRLWPRHISAGVSPRSFTLT